MGVQVVRGNDVDDGHLRDRPGMIEGKAVRHAAAAIMPHDRKAVEAVVLHEVDGILCHRPLRIVDVFFTILGLAAVPVAPQVRRDHRVFLCQFRRDAEP
jgi:hypothetical protein